LTCEDVLPYTILRSFLLAAILFIPDLLDVEGLSGVDVDDYLSNIVIVRKTFLLVHKFFNLSIDVWIASALKWRELIITVL
jgi:hypothetical protein